VRLLPGGDLLVNSSADTDAGVCNVANCTLREAIGAANRGQMAAFLVKTFPLL
jgi:CSLREA domain-containing protein